MKRYLITALLIVAAFGAGRWSVREKPAKPPILPIVSQATDISANTVTWSLPIASGGVHAVMQGERCGWNHICQWPEHGKCDEGFKLIREHGIAICQSVEPIMTNHLDHGYDKTPTAARGVIGVGGGENGMSTLTKKDVIKPGFCRCDNGTSVCADSNGRVTSIPNSCTLINTEGNGKQVGGGSSPK